MADLSDYTRQKLTDWITGKASMPATTTRYVGLWDGDPKAGGTEVTTTIRAAGRLALSATAADSQGNASNSLEVNFGDAAGAASVSYVGIHDASSAGNLITADALSGGTQEITAGTPVVFAAGELVFACS